jgi:hypothetical protein
MWQANTSAITYEFNGSKYVLVNNFSLINIDSIKTYNISWIESIKDQKEENVAFDKIWNIIEFKNLEEIKVPEEVKCSFIKYSIQNVWDKFSINKNLESNKAICWYSAYDWSLYSITLDWKNVYWD